MQFDAQADIYDERTGLGAKTAQNIATALGQMIQPYLTGQFLEIGAGTGEIGCCLQELGIPYAGMDLSAGMLDVYRQRYQLAEDVPELMQTDANQAWPFAPKSVSVFFSSRAMHQLDHDNVLKQLELLADPAGAILVLGNVKRSKTSVKAIMRKTMHKALNEFGLQEKSGQSNRNLLFSTLEQLGGIKLAPVTASRWQVSHTPMASIQSWQSVDGIAGQAVEPDVKTQILAAVTRQAQEKFTDLEQALEAEETYELNAIKLSYNKR